MVLFVLYCIFLGLIVWSVAYSDILLLRVGNRYTIFFTSVIVSLIILSRVFIFTRASNRYALNFLFMLLTCAVVMLNFVSSPAQLDSIRYKIEKRGSFSLSEWSLTSPHETIRKRNFYYSLREFLQGNECEVNTVDDINIFSLKSLSGVVSVKKVKRGKGYLTEIRRLKTTDKIVTASKESILVKGNLSGLIRVEQSDLNPKIWFVFSPETLK